MNGQVQDDEVLIAVMGATGSGKTTFINLVTNSDLQVGGGLRSCTSDVQVASPCELGGRRVYIIDTPGFDDTTKSDTDILKLIAAFLTTTYQNGRKLAGVIYIHRISDFRMGGISARNFKMFRELCGDTTLKNVVIVTNMWGEVSLEKGEAREKELASDFFKGVLAKGAKFLRHYNTLASAQDILYQIIGNTPTSLLIQRELVDQGKDLSQTAAGGELSRELAELAKKHREEMVSLKKDMEDAMRQRDEETRRELEEEYNKVKDEMRRVQADSQRLASDYLEERTRMESRMEQLQEAARQEAARAEAQHKRQLEELQRQLNIRSHVSTAERAEMLKKLAQIQQQYEESKRGRSRGCVIM